MEKMLTTKEDRMSLGLPVDTIPHPNNPRVYMMA
jgi:hypothetical protein